MSAGIRVAFVRVAATWFLSSSPLHSESLPLDSPWQRGLSLGRRKEELPALGGVAPSYDVFSDETPVEPGQEGESVAEDERPMKCCFQLFTAPGVKDELVVTNQDRGKEHENHDWQQVERGSFCSRCQRHQYKYWCATSGESDQFTAPFRFADLAFRDPTVKCPVSQPSEGRQRPCGSNKPKLPRECAECAQAGESPALLDQ